MARHCRGGKPGTSAGEKEAPEGKGVAMAAMAGLLRKELARRTGCNSETIRYYERIGLLDAPPRAANGYRIYDERHLRQLRFIMRARALGFTLEEIRELLSLRERGRPCREVAAITRRHLETVRGKIRDLERIARRLADTLERCEAAQESGATAGCAILEALETPGTASGRTAAQEGENGAAS